MKMHILLLLLLLVPFVEGCSGEASMQVPAVIGDGGGLVNASIRLVPGDGQIFITVNPYTATDTQMSMEEALEVAREESGNDGSECDFLISFERLDLGGRIEGPSAGAAMAVVAYSLLEENATIRQDAIITGSISSGGRIGAVGGLAEKAKAAALDGADYFIIPPATFYEMLLLKDMEEEYNLSILEVQNASDLIGFMLYNQTIEQVDFRAAEAKPPDIESYDTTGMKRFAEVSEEIILLLNNTLRQMMPDGPESQEAKKYFENKLYVTSVIFERGYLFTAANSAFLDYIEVSTIAAILDDRLDLEAKERQVLACFDSIERPAMTDQNFEWVIGSQLREAWARNAIELLDMEEPLLTEERYAIYHELMYADAWCHVSESLADAAGNEGSEFDEAVWKALAEEMLDEAEELPHSIDTGERLVIARNSYVEGNYGAAIYDCVFVIEMDGAEADFTMLSEEELFEQVDYLSNEERTSIWGKAYQAQGVFLAKEEVYATSYKILKLAKGLDIATEQMAEEIELQREEEIADGLEELIIMVLQLAIIIIFVLLLSYAIIQRFRKRGLHGNKDKRYSRSTRAKQKKGRA